MKHISLVFFLLLGCLAPLSAAPLTKRTDGQPLRIACVGDSITQGTGAARGLSYPSQLQDLLGKDGVVGNFGVSGRTLLRKGDFPYWNEKAFQQAQDFRPDAVIIMLGTNDTKPGNWTHSGDFVQDYTDLVNTFRNLQCKPKVYVCRPCPVPEPGKYGINEKNIQQEIIWLDKLAKDLGLDVIDMHAALVDKPMLLPDRVHPDSGGAAEMAKVAFVALTGRAVNATLAVNSLFSDHAILQRGISHPIWGTAPDGEKIEIDFAGQKLSTVAKDGKWQVMLKPLSASAVAQSLTVRSANTMIVTNDILVGDVWLASGQSNMERQLGPRPPQKEIIGYKEAVAAADLPLIRQFYVPQRMGPSIIPGRVGDWSLTTPQTAANFTAVGFFFARDLQPAVGVPVGIIHASWGGTNAETWVSPSALAALGDIATTNGRDANGPSVLYKSMIAPLLPFPIRGVIWYQGESNSTRGSQYRSLFPALIEDWRKQWNQAKLPFLFVQIAPFNDMTPEIREAQFLTLQKESRTAMVVTTDIGDASDIHPAQKQPVGARLALAARALSYGENIGYSGPLYKAMKVVGPAVWIAFDHVGGGLIVKDGGELRGFTIAGSDKNFVPAKAQIKGDKVIVTSDQVINPVAVRYGWANVPDVNLANKDGLPASPFRTDVE